MALEEFVKHTDNEWPGFDIAFFGRGVKRTEKGTEKTSEAVGFHISLADEDVEDEVVAQRDHLVR